MADHGKSRSTILLALIFAAAILLQSFYIADRRLATTVMFLLIGAWIAVDSCLQTDKRCRVKVPVRRQPSGTRHDVPGNRRR